MLAVGENVTHFLLSKLGVNEKMIAAAVDRQLASLLRVTGGGEPYLSRESNDVITKALDLAKKEGDEFVGLEVLLRALLAVSSTASTILKDAGITDKALAEAIKELRGGAKATSASSEDTYQALSKYARNLVEEARDGKLDPVIGRDEEIAEFSIVRYYTDDIPPRKLDKNFRGLIVSVQKRKSEQLYFPGYSCLRFCLSSDCCFLRFRCVYEVGSLLVGEAEPVEVGNAADAFILT